MQYFKYKKSTEPFTHLLIETEEELHNYLEYARNSFDNEIQTFLTMKNSNMAEVSIQKFVSHTLFSTPIVKATKQIEMINVHPFKNNLLQTITKAGNFLISYFNNEYEKTLKLVFNKYDGVAINVAGGCMPKTLLTKEEYENVTQKLRIKNNNIELFNTKNCFLNPYYRTLVLENDPQIDSYTQHYFEEKKEGFSYIVNLRKAMETTEFEDFITKNKLTKIFVYTTGLDLGQMEDYTTRAINCGVTSFEIIFALEDNIEAYKTFVEAMNLDKQKITFIVKMVNETKKNQHLKNNKTKMSF